MLNKLAEQARQAQDGAAMVVKDPDEMVAVTATATATAAARTAPTALSPVLSLTSSSSLLPPISIVLPPFTPSRMSSASSSAPSPTPTLESLATPTRLDAILRVTEFPPDEQHDHQQPQQPQHDHQQRRQTPMSAARSDTGSASPVMESAAVISPPVLFSGASASPQMVSSESDTIVRDAGDQASSPLVSSSSLIQRPKPGKSKLNAFAMDWVQHTRGGAAGSGFPWRPPASPRKNSQGPNSTGRPVPLTGLTPRASSPTAMDAVVSAAAATSTSLASPHTFATIVGRGHTSDDDVEPRPQSANMNVRVVSGGREEKCSRRSEADAENDEEAEQVTSTTHGTAYHVYTIYPPFVVQRFLEFVRRWIITGNPDVTTMSVCLNSTRKPTTQPPLPYSLSSSSSPTPLALTASTSDDASLRSDDDSTFRRGSTPTPRASAADAEHADDAVCSVAASYDILEVYSDFKYAAEMGRSAKFPEIVPRTHSQVQAEPMRYVLKVLVTPSMANALKRLGFVNSLHPYKKQAMNSVVPYMLEIAPLVCVCSPSLSFHPIAPWSPTYPVASSFVVRLQPEIASLKTTHLMAFFKHLLKTLAKYELMPPNGWTIERSEKYHDVKPASSTTSSTSQASSASASPAMPAVPALQTPQQPIINHEIRINFSRYPMTLLSVACTLLKDMSYNLVPVLDTLANSPDGSPLSASDREQLDTLRRTCRIACQFATLPPHPVSDTRTTAPSGRAASSHVVATTTTASATTSASPTTAADAALWLHIPRPSSSPVAVDSELTSPSPSPDSSSGLTTPSRIRGSIRFGSPRGRGNSTRQRGSSRGTRSRGRGYNKAAAEPSLPSSSSP